MVESIKTPASHEARRFSIFSIPVFSGAQEIAEDEGGFLAAAEQL
jgi:hypothetical protein